MNLREEIGRYHNFEELTRILQTFEAEFPAVCHLRSIGKTLEQRDIYLMEVTNFLTGSGEDKPGYYAEACTHAEEFSGTNVALRLIYDLVTGYGQQAEVNELLDTTVFYIIPQVNPDGVETVMTTGTIGVCNGKYPVEERQPLPGLVPQDLNGDHIIAQMRIPDPDGEWKISEKDPRLMTLRKPYERQGSFYRMVPEGVIRGNVDGFEIPKPKDVNLNRNYPANWLPEGLQYGACELPLSEPETRAVAEFIDSHPNIAGVVSYHTNAGAIMRPFGGKGDEQFQGADLALYHALGAMGTEELGYELMSTYNDFTPDKSRVRGGTLMDWTFEFLGIPSFMLELWNVYDAAGTTRPKEFHFAAKSEEKDLEVLRWADRYLGEKGYLPWKKVSHPQLGEVEVGGFNWLWVERNPPECYLEEMSGHAAAYTRKLAMTLPRLNIRKCELVDMGNGRYKLTAVVRNGGYLPTYLTSQAIAVKKAPPVKLELVAVKGKFEIECCTHPEEIGHLEGRFGRDGEWSRDRAEWRPVERKAEWVIRTDAAGTTEAGAELELELTASAPRCGRVSRRIVPGEKRGAYVF